VNHKTGKIDAWVAAFQGQDMDPYYLGFFHFFNLQQYFEAHEVLEAAWLPQRHGPDGAYYKGLIQLAGAFVHIQKGRPGPAVALFRLAQGNLMRYAPVHHRLDLEKVLALIEAWKARINTGDVLMTQNRIEGAPAIELLDAKS